MGCEWIKEWQLSGAYGMLVVLSVSPVSCAGSWYTLLISAPFATAWFNSILIAARVFSHVLREFNPALIQCQWLQHQGSSAVATQIFQIIRDLYIYIRFISLFLVASQITQWEPPSWIINSDCKTLAGNPSGSDSNLESRGQMLKNTLHTTKWNEYTKIAIFIILYHRK